MGLTYELILGNDDQKEDQSIELGGNTYKINNLFRQGAIEVANSLDIDELEAAELFLDAQSDSDASGQPARTCAIIRFHQRRKELLDCLRLTLELSQDDEREDFDREWLRAFIDEVTIPENQSTNNESRFTRRCLSSMGDIRTWLREISTKAEVINQQQPQTDEALEKLEVLSYERASLINQHESLSIIVYYLTKNYSVMSDLEVVLENIRNMNKHDEILRKCQLCQLKPEQSLVRKPLKKTNRI